jgi:23S rRNA pseudouridine2605 synthase
VTDPVRLQKVLARAGVASRRKVEDLIVAGRVRVNGQRAELGRRVDVSKDKVEVDGNRVPLDPELVYYLLNKPAGTVSTASDPEGRPTVIDLVPVAARIWSVGRLDVDTEGALLLTNDGELTERLTHPRHGVPKTYLARVPPGLPGRALKDLLGGVELEDGPARAQAVRLVERGPGGVLVEVTVGEGRNRMVRRMFESIGTRVDRLVRTSIGPLMLGRLKPGQFRRLGPAEVNALYAAGSRPGDDKGTGRHVD